VSATADPFQTRLTEARLRRLLRLLKSKTAAAAALADIYTGKHADF
jgi:hypothetical protein